MTQYLSRFFLFGCLFVSLFVGFVLLVFCFGALEFWRFHSSVTLKLGKIT